MANSSAQNSLLFDWPPKGYDSRVEYALYSRVYDLMYGSRDEDLAFYRSYAKRFTGPVMEIGCGSGRLTAELATLGRPIIAIDNSRDMIRLCEQRLGKALKLKVSLCLKDARQFDLKQKFDLIIAPFAMVAHLLSDKDRLDAFQNVFKHLSPGGTFVFDDANRAGWEISKDSSKLELKRTVIDPVSRDPVRMLSNYFRDSERPVFVRYDFIDWLEGDFVKRRMVLRVTFRDSSPREQLNLLKCAGFHSAKVFGDWKMSPYNFKEPESNKRVIFEARKEKNR
jgi:SAM-dependent methyltransferase